MDEIKEHEKIVDGLALKLAGIDSWERFANLIEKNHFIVKANEVIDYLEAAGYRKPASLLPEMKLIGEAVEIIKDLTDKDDCSVDHHGYCQTHGWLQSGVCPHFRAKAFLDKAQLAADRKE